jgi:hypothetical protein
MPRKSRLTVYPCPSGLGVAVEEELEAGNDVADRNRRIVELRDEGASWLQIQEEFGLSRQQARYAYQLGKRAVRRKGRRDK